MSSIRIEEPSLFETASATAEVPDIVERDWIEYFLIACIVVSTFRYLKQRLYNSTDQKNK